MKRPIKSIACLACLALVLVCGCQIVGKGPSDEELIRNTLSDWAAAIKAQDIDKVMATYSEEFESSETPDKETHRDLIAGYIDAGYMDESEMDLESAEVTIEDGKASVTGVGFTTVMGDFGLDFALQKEGGAWLIIDFEYY